VSAIEDAVRRVKKLQLAGSPGSSAPSCPPGPPPSGGGSRPQVSQDDPLFRNLVFQEIRAILQPSVCDGSSLELSLRAPNMIVLSGQMRDIGENSGRLTDLKKRWTTLEFDPSGVRALGFCAMPLGDGLTMAPGSGGSRTAKLADVTDGAQARLFDEGKCPEIGPRFAKAIANPAEARRGFWVQRSLYRDLAICQANADGRWTASAFGRNQQDAVILLQGEQ
jgi:hypothetical protein